MRLFVDLDTRSFIESVQFPRVISTLTLKRRDRLPVDVQFLRDSTVVDIAAGALGKLGLKANRDFNGPFVASDLSWTKSGSGESTSFRFDLNLNTVQIDALFAGVPTPASVPLMLEVEWNEDGLRTSSSTLAITLENDVVRGDEGAAEEGGPIYPAPEDLFSMANLAIGPVTVGEDTVDLTVAGLDAPPTLCVPLGIQKPNHEADNIGIVAAFPVSASTLRAYLTAAPSEPGYTATILFRA